MDPDNKDFKALQTEWYRLLKDEGFDDIEQSDGNLKVWTCYRFKVPYNEVSHRARVNYYRLAGQFLYDHKFKNKRERTIWELHSQGISDRQITHMMKKRNFKIYKFLVQSTVAKLSYLMVQKCKG